MRGPFVASLYPVLLRAPLVMRGFATRLARVRVVGRADMAARRTRAMMPGRRSRTEVRKRRRRRRHRGCRRRRLVGGRLWRRLLRNGRRAKKCKRKACQQQTNESHETPPRYRCENAKSAVLLRASSCNAPPQLPHVAAQTDEPWHSAPNPGRIVRGPGWEESRE